MEEQSLSDIVAAFCRNTDGSAGPAVIRSFDAYGRPTARLVEREETKDKVNRHQTHSLGQGPYPAPLLEK